ncbi:unnamed protein product [Candidula unifasciata]|uniref:Uncharacterized protein n=1 Tax=Candidula unifasciata TaxID=100452 RepID=A0A8S3ZU47_9EUPU|nr:unnamed protein product [Candidula unifasciata]
MTMRFVSLALTLLVFHDASCHSHNVKRGFELQFQNSPEELENVAMNFTGKAPSWLNGTLVRVGPALFELGNGSTVTSTLDGFAKVAKWKFEGNSITFSTKFIRSTYYNESLANEKFTSNIFFSPPLPRLTPAEAQRSQEVGIDNMDITIVKFKDTKKQAIRYVAKNDVVPAYELSLDDLSTYWKLQPVLPGAPAAAPGSRSSPSFLKQLATSHPLPEPNTDFLINLLIQAASTPQEVNMLKVIRVKSPEEIEVIASIAIPEVPLIHSFGLSQTKAIVLMNPYIMNATCRMWNEDNCYTWQQTNDSTALYVVDLKTGNVQNFLVPAIFVYHHINSYDEGADTVIADVAAYDSPIPHTKFELPRLRDTVARGMIDPRADMKRIVISLSNATATVSSIESPTPISKLASTLDYPVINEVKRSKQYCYVYGIIEKVDNVNIETVAVAKKDLCKNDGRDSDALYALDGWYPSEPTFVPNPGATSEDDGVLLVPFTSADTNRTNLVMLNAEDLKLIDKAEGPILIPQSQHGIYIDL